MLLDRCATARVTAVLVAVVTGAGAARVHAQAQDECTTSTSVLTLTSPLQMDTTAATDSLSLGPTTACGPTDGLGGTADVFARFTPVQTGRYRITTCGSAVDTVVSVHSACPATVGNLIACGDEPVGGACASGDPGAGGVEVNLVGGQARWVRVAGKSGARGAVTLAASVVPPANDECANAIDVSTGLTTVANAGATGTNITPCAGVDPNDVWYRFTAPQDGWFHFTMINLATDGTVLLSGSMALYDACGGTPVRCERARIKHQMIAGQTFIVRVYAPATEVAAISIEAGPPPLPPANDTCANATVIPPQGFVDRVEGWDATPDLGMWCINPTLPVTNYGIWYRYTATGNVLLNVHPTGSLLYRTVVFKGGCDGLEPVVCSVNGISALVDVMDGETVYALVAIAGADAPNFQYIVTATVTQRSGSCCSGDACARTTAPACGGDWSGGTCALAAPVTYPATFPEPVAIPQGSDLTSTIAVPDGFPIGDIAVSFTLNHTALNNLVFRLTGPGGSNSELGTNDGTTADLSGTFTLRDSAERTMGMTDRLTGQVPPGVYRAGGTRAGTRTRMLETWGGRQSAGNWTFSVQDSVTGGADTGTITGWSLTLYPVAPSPCAPPCPADFDGEAGVVVADIFAFLSAWFGGDPRADFNGSGGVPDVSDIFAFLSAWFAGCP